jgi:hypothetical protein
MNEAQKEQWRLFICKRPDEKKLLHLNDNVDWLQATADMFFVPCIYPHSKNDPPLFVIEREFGCANSEQKGKFCTLI